MPKKICTFVMKYIFPTKNSEKRSFMPSLLYERNKETPTIEKRDGCNNLHVIRVVNSSFVTHYLLSVDTMVLRK